MPYTPTPWAAGEAGGTLVTADALNNMETGIGDNDLDDPDSKASLLLAATFVPRWAANTAYAIGAKVLSPTGDIVSAIAAFTSGPAYVAGNWALSTTFATPAQVASQVAAIPKPSYANTMVLFGDSWEYFNLGDPTHPTRPSPSSRGYAANGNAQLGHRLDIINKGIGGEDTLNMIARMQASLVDVAAGWAMIGSGTNDISNGRTFNAISQNLTILYNAAVASGKRVVGRTIPPRNAATAAQKLLRSQVNNWLRGQAITRPGFILVDIEQAVMDPLTNEFITGYSYDGVHLSNPGAIAAGEAFANALRPHVPAAPILLSAGDPRNMLPSLGGAFPGAAGAVPTGWAANGWSQGVPIYSKVPRTDGLPGQWQQLVVPTDSRGFLRSTQLTPATGPYAAGDVIRAAVEFQVEGLEVAPTAGTQSLYLSLELFDGTTTTARYDLEYLAAENENMGTRSRSGVLVTSALTIPANVPAGSALSMAIQARCGGTYRFGRASLYKV